MANILKIGESYSENVLQSFSTYAEIVDFIYTARYGEVVVYFHYRSNGSTDGVMNFMGANKFFVDYPDEYPNPPHKRSSASAVNLGGWSIPHYPHTQPYVPAEKPKCECGAHRTNYPNWHAPYCPMYTKE